MAKDRTDPHHGSASDPVKKNADDWLGFLLGTSAAVVARRTSEVLRPFGLTPRSFGFLVQLRAHGPASQLEIARAIRMDRTTSSQLVEELAARSMVVRDIDPEDRRHNQLSLTTHGQTVLSAAEDAATQVEERLLDGMSDARRAALLHGLRHILSVDPRP